MEEEGKKQIPWTKKKSLALAGALLGLILLLLCFVPMFTCKDEAGHPYYGNLIEYFHHPAGNPLAGAILLSVSGLLILFGMYRLIRSLFYHPEDGDNEDRHFVFGYLLFIGGCAFYAVSFFTAGSFVAAMVGLFLTFYGIVATVVHFKFLSEI